VLAQHARRQPLHVKVERSDNLPGTEALPGGRLKSFFEHLRKVRGFVWRLMSSDLRRIFKRNSLLVSVGRKPALAETDDIPAMALESELATLPRI
jgi:hypothetical protein